MNNISILIALHKPYEVPKDQGYLPLHLGKATSSLILPYQGDDTGENISSLNNHFCELTGLYWLWKNQKSDIYGLVHYRRYFTTSRSKLTLAGKKICSTKELSKYLEDHDIVLSKPRNYIIETIEQHYNNAHYAQDLKILKEVLLELYPQYKHSYDYVMSSRKASLYNMFVARSEHFYFYCEWVFSILFEVQNRVSYKNYDAYQSRVFGFMAERLLNIWVHHNIPFSRIKYLPVINIEGENICKKALNMVIRKVRGQSRMSVKK